MSFRVRPELSRIAPYVPGKPVAEVEREYGVSHAIKLASNENPLGPSPAALKAVREVLEGVHRYPDGAGVVLREALASKFGVGPDQVILGNGSDEVVALLCNVLLAPGDEAVMAAPTFGVYRIAVLSHQGTPVEVPLTAGRHDLAAMLARVTDRTKLFFICNPNSPTGTALSRREVLDAIDRLPPHVVAVCDHAYEDYVTSADFPFWGGVMEEGRRVVILRTFSKIYGLAGLRIGYGVGPAELVDWMNRIRLPFNASTVAQAAALAALGDDAHVRASRMVNAAGKTYFTKECARLGLAVLPSEANFLYIDVGRDARALFERLLREGVIVRHFDGRWLRITIGLPEENTRCMAALEKVLTDEGGKG
ncbi:MAG: histidinol-phosphate transaminase [Nitrospirota bacterium]